MRIVQSFWSCDKNLLKNSFGWLSPQHHLIAWALSCLTIHEYYDDLHLYTDTNGYDILIKYLNLPYKSIQTGYDNVGRKQENNYALVKLLTYAAQREPFIHVDGDVFIWERFDQTLENAQLIAQNQEKGTEYYKSLMDGLKNNMEYLPDFVKTELNKTSISSFNAGILGGNDVDFLNEYANVGLNLIEKNYTDDKKLGWSFNILFEQILFYSLSRKNNKQVTCFLDETIEDFGYSKEKFADFSLVPHRLKYLHLIGDKKRDNEICELMSRTLFQRYPEYFFKIVTLFKREHVYFYTKIKSFLPNTSYESPPTIDQRNEVGKYFAFYRTAHALQSKQKNNVKLTKGQLISAVEKSNCVDLKEVFRYEQQLAHFLTCWRKIDNKELYSVEWLAINGFELFFQSKKLQETAILRKNPHLEIIENSFDWSHQTKIYINPHLICEDASETLGLACIPQLFFNGYNEIVIDELDYNVLTILQEPHYLKNILCCLEDCFGVKDNEGSNTFLYELILLRLKRFFLNKCVFIEYSL